MIRRKTHTVQVGHVTIGSSSPVVIQAMTNTDTADAIQTALQIKALAQAGSQLVRMTINSPEAAAAVTEIRSRLNDMDCTVPLVGDFHFNGEKLLAAYPECARTLDKYRINPGNVGKGLSGSDKFSSIIRTAAELDKAVRIGVNWGSLDQNLARRLMDENQSTGSLLSAEEIQRKALITSALESAQKAIDLGLPRDKIILSCKVSDVQDLITVYQDLAHQCDFPLHLGLTEAGMGSKGIVASSAALAILLQQGIGDTIRVSLTPEPNGDRTREVIVAQEILQSLGLRRFAPTVTACPGCGRTGSSLFQSLAQEIDRYLRHQMPDWQHRYRGVENMKVAVMGCVVNGPGESKLADIGISLPGKGESPVAPVYMDGEYHCTLKGENIATEFTALIEQYVTQKYS